MQPKEIQSTNIQLATHINHKNIQTEHIKTSKHLNLADQKLALNLQVSEYEQTTINDQSKQLIQVMSSKFSTHQ